MTSIFENYNNIETTIFNENFEKEFGDDEITILHKIFTNFVEVYSEENLLNNIKLFCQDAKKLFKINTKFWELGIKEFEESDEKDSEEAKEKMEKVKKIITDSNLLIEQFPDDDFINNSENQIIYDYLQGNQNKFKILCTSIINFYNEINQDMQALNDTMNKMNNKLGNTIVVLKAHQINKELKSRVESIKGNYQTFIDKYNGNSDLVPEYKDFIDNYLWFIDNYLEINNTMKEYECSDENIMVIKEILENVINNYKPLFDKSENST